MNKISKAKKKDWRGNIEKKIAKYKYRESYRERCKTEHEKFKRRNELP